MIEEYLQHQKERNAQGIPAKPLDASQTGELCRLLQSPPAGKEALLLNLLECQRLRLRKGSVLRTAFAYQDLYLLIFIFKRGEFALHDIDLLSAALLRQ